MLKKSVSALLVLLLLAVPGIISAQDGVSVDCGDGLSIENGIEVLLIDAQPGVTYRATAIGINGFDPVMAVVDGAGNGSCNDDGDNVNGYGVNLLTTGEVEATSFSSQLDFEQPRGAEGGVSIIVGGYGGAAGEFVLVIEGLSLTGEESFGGVPVGINLTNPMVNSGVTLTTYLVSIENALDTALYAVDSQGNTLTDPDGTEVYCDDSGSDSTCFGGAHSLEGSSITMERGTLGATEYDSVLNLALNAFQLSEDRAENYLYLLLTSYNRQLAGEFVVAFHMGIGEATGSGNPPPRQGGDSGGGSGAVAGGYAVNCDNGTSFSNGVEVIISQMRSGYTYTATAVGINNFDPVLAVVDPNGNGLCNDDDANAASYAANLPTTGRVSASSFSSQIMFDQNSREAFADVSLVVGGFGDQTGEFLLILEGMAATSADNGGDPFLLQVTQPMINSGVPVTVYMLTRGQSGVDPVIYMLDGDNNPLADNDGNQVYCDDAGNANTCYGYSERLDNYTVTINTGTLPGWQYDAMLSLPLEAFTFQAGQLNYLTYLMSSFSGSEGQYLLVFHIGTGG